MTTAVVSTTTGEIRDDVENTPRLAAALVAFQAEVPSVSKARTATVTGKDGSRGYTYTYASLADVCEVALPLLTKHGLAFTTLPTRSTFGYELVGVLLHESGERLESTFPIYGNNPQQIGSSLTYGRRYLLGCMTGVVVDDDDDGQAAQGAQGRTQGTGQRPDGYETGPQRAERIKGTPADDPWYTNPPTQKSDAEEPLPSPGEQAPPDRSEPQVDARTPGGAKKSQIQAVAIKFRALGIENRDERLGRTRTIVNRPTLGSANDLTEAEALRVLDVLEADLTAKEESKGAKP